MADLVGETLGKYQIIEKLGRGGMAEVYKAYHAALDRFVAIKVMHTHLADGENFQERFQREAIAVATLRHQNIVQVYDFDIEDGYYYMVMEYIPSISLRDKLTGYSQSKTYMSFDHGIDIIIQIARALSYAHQEGMLHRDIKPSNILLDKNGRAYLTDFGIAKIMGKSSMTMTGNLLGTPQYMSPEQCKGEELSAASDVYALGITLYEILTGQVPFAADTPLAIVQKQVASPLPSPRNYRADLPEPLEKLLYKALEKDPGDRYPNVDAFLTAINQVKKNLNEMTIMVGIAASQETLIETVPQPYQGQRRLDDIVTKDSPGSEIPGKERSRYLVPLLLISLVIVIVAFAIYYLNSQGIAISKAQPSQTPVVITATNNHPETPSQPSTSETMVDAPQPSEPTATIPTPTVLPPSPTITRSPSYGIGATAISPKDYAVLVYVPEGEFLRGSIYDTLGWAIDECSQGSDTWEECAVEYQDETPQRSIYLDGFWVDKTQVTNQMYANFLNAIADRNAIVWTWVDTGDDILLIEETSEGWQPKSGYDNHPVIGVSWNGALAYCQWMDRRLLTEAEWEKAARGTDGRMFPWGDGISCSQAQYEACSGQTIPVGIKLSGASPYSVLDMAGNVWDWTMDWYDEDYYNVAPDSNPPGPAFGEFRVIRGGSWRSPMRFLRSAFRDYRSPDYAGNNLGFRCMSNEIP